MPEKNTKNTADEQVVKLIPCITSHYPIARECAELTIDEIGDLLESTGNFDRGAAYAALGLATATGTVLAFHGGGTALKGLAVATGSLLGLNSVVKTKEQRPILEKALKDMSCYLRAADSINNIETTDIDKLSTSVRTSFSSLRLSQANIAASVEKGSYENVAVILQGTYSEEIEGNNNNILASVRAAKKSIGTELSSAVIARRAEIRKSLAALTPEPSSLVDVPRDRTISIVAKTIMTRTEQKKILNKPLALSGLNENGLKVTQEILALTEAVSTVFSSCVDPATDKALNPH